MSKISYLQHDQIDKKRWDNTIDSSVNKRVYALSWYLDMVSPGWEALVMGDYESIMPLPSKQKLFIKYLIQPVLCQQLGVYTGNNDGHIDIFIEKIRSRFLYINLNFGIPQLPINSSHIFDKRTNHELYLNSDYSVLAKNYSRRTIRNIKVANESGLRLSYTMSAKEFTDFKRNFSNPGLKENFFSSLQKICEHFIGKKMGEIVATVNSNEEILSAAFYFIYDTRLYFTVTVSNAKGKENSAMHLILDSIIKKYANSDLILDFTGSSLKGVAYFNEGFGAKSTTYYSFIYSRLPKFLKN